LRLAIGACGLHSDSRRRTTLRKWLEAHRPAGYPDPAEAAALGQKALSINNPEQKHHLQKFCGGTTISALQVVCILYVGVQLLLPGQDAGIDFDREYELAKGMAGGDP